VLLVLVLGGRLFGFGGGCGDWGKGVGREWDLGVG